jgi:hypothetical protein
MLSSMINLYDMRFKGKEKVTFVSVSSSFIVLIGIFSLLLGIFVRLKKLSKDLNH